MVPISATDGVARTGAGVPLLRGGNVFGAAGSGAQTPPPQPKDEYITLLPDAGGRGSDHNADEQFSPEELRLISELQARDREVRAHEQAHISAGGAYIRGGASYEYEQGPDNRRYAVGGEVSIDTSPERDDPEATIAKMQVVRAAALAPADPSAQDRAVASAASREEARAAAELNERRAAEAAEAYAAPAADTQIPTVIDLVA